MFSKIISNKMFDVSLLFVVLTSGITNIHFAHGRILIAMLPLATLLLFYVLSTNPRSWPRVLAPQPQDYALIPFFLFTLLSWIMYPNSKSVIYISVYFFSFVVLGMIMRNLMANRGSWRLLNLANLVAIAVTTAFGVVEFLYGFLLNPPFHYENDLQYYIPRPSPWNDSALCNSLPRVYSFANEPTYLGWYYNSLGPLALAFLWRETRLDTVVKSALTTIIMLGYLLTWSTSTWFMMLVGLGIAIFAKATRRWWVPNDVPASQRGLIDMKKSKGNLVAIAIPLVFIGCFLGITNIGPRNLYEEIPGCLGILADKAMLRMPDTVTSGATTQATDNGNESDVVTKRTIPLAKKLQATNFTRTRIWKDDLNGALKKPMFGHGVGFLSSIGRDSSLNLFLFVAYEQGFPAALSLILYYTILGICILRQAPPSYRLILVASYSAGVLHLLTMTQHFYFNLWVMIGLFYLAARSASNYPRPFRA